MLKELVKFSGNSEEVVKLMLSRDTLGHLALILSVNND
jgi:hypothetical protein